MPWDWRKEFAKQHGFTPGAPAEPEPANPPPRVEPDVEPLTGEGDECSSADHVGEVNEMVPSEPAPQPDAVEDEEPVEMVEIAPHRTVNARFLRRGGAL